MKKELLIIYPEMYIGGSTTSLLSLLQKIDYLEFTVDLLLVSAKGQLAYMVPEHVNFLPSPLRYRNRTVRRVRKLFSLYSVIQTCRAIILSKHLKSANVRQQITQRDSARYTYKQSKRYDVAISYLEMWPMYYLANKVDATKKIAWYHIDLVDAKLLAKLEKRTLQKMDHVVLISEKAKAGFDALFPEFKSKSIVIENMLSKSVVEQRSKVKINCELENFSIFKMKLITVCRIDFKSKGLDRGVSAFNRLKTDGLLDSVGWYIVGDGSDMNSLKMMIQDKGLEDHIILCGAKENPMPFVARCDIFFLPSRYEGKPMAVTEAMMLGVIPFVTEYSAAKEQIHDGYEGVVVPNTDEDIYKGLRNLIQGKYDLSAISSNLSKKEFDISAMEEINKLLK